MRRVQHIQHSIRIPLKLDKALRRAADIRQVTPYSLLQQCVRAGIGSLSGEQEAPQLAAEVVKEIADISSRLAHLERLTERALYVGCASYVCARASSAPNTDDAQLTSQINAAFARQLKRAGEP